MEELVGRHPDGIQETVSLQVLIDLWFGEGRIATKVVPILFVLVSLDDRVQNFLPTISAVNITRAQQDAFTIVQAEARVRPLKHGPPTDWTWPHGAPRPTTFPARSASPTSYSAHSSPILNRRTLTTTCHHSPPDLLVPAVQPGSFSRGRAAGRGVGDAPIRTARAQPTRCHPAQSAGSTSACSSTALVAFVTARRSIRVCRGRPRSIPSMTAKPQRLGSRTGESLSG